MVLLSIFCLPFGVGTPVSVTLSGWSHRLVPLPLYSAARATKDDGVCVSVGCTTRGQEGAGLVLQLHALWGVDVMSLRPVIRSQQNRRRAVLTMGLCTFSVIDTWLSVCRHSIRDQGGCLKSEGSGAPSPHTSHTHTHSSVSEPVPPRLLPAVSA